MSRLRENPERLFEVFLEVGKPADKNESPFILQKYPLDYDDQEVLKSKIPDFAFPCDTERYTTTVDHFTFTLTDIESKYKFGFCRHATGAQTCFCIISFLPWFEIFYNLLNVLAEITNRTDDNDVTVMLREAYVTPVPGSGVPVTIVAQQEMFSFKAPEINKLPSIPASRNLTEYYNAIDTTNMMIIFASMLHERRIVVTSKKLSRLTAVVHAAAGLLYPMFWQHLFIPVLPSFLIDYLSAPMPFVIGVHVKLMEKVRNSELGDAVVVDADKNTVTTEYDDVEDLPDEIASHLKRHLKGEKVKTSMQGTGDVISKTFMMSLVKLIGGYRDALKFNEGETITFNPDAFVQSRPMSIQPFLENMLQLQIFQQFINDRLDMLNCGQGFTDMFEQECLLHADKLNAQSRYREWTHNMKKQGKKMQRGGKDVWSDFKDKAGPAMTSAVESVKIQSKKAYSGFRHKMGEIKKDDSSSVSAKSNKNARYAVSAKSFHKEKSAGILKVRPSTIVGPALTTHRPPRPPTSPGVENKTPMRPRISRQQPSTDRIIRHIQHGDGEKSRKSSDDSDILMYSRVSCNLMSDPDIQSAMFKSVSAENLPKRQPHLQTSDSSGTLTSSSSSSDIDADDLPFIDEHCVITKHPDSSFVSYTSLFDGDDNDSGIVVKTSSQSSLKSSSQTSLDKNNSQSEFVDLGSSESVSSAAGTSKLETNVSRPRPAPRKSIGINDQLMRPQNLDTSVTDSGRPPTVTKRKLLEKSADELLINLVSPSDPDKTPVQDPNAEMDLSSQVQYRNSPNTPNSYNRRSISRTNAMKMPADLTPKRPSVRREKSPISPDERTPTGSMSTFDPLFGGQTESPPLPPRRPKQPSEISQTQSPAETNLNNNADFDLLLKTWDLGQITSVSNTPNYKFSQPASSPSLSQRPGYQTMTSSPYYSQSPQIQSSYTGRPSPAVPPGILGTPGSSRPPPDVSPKSTSLQTGSAFSSPQTLGQSGIMQPQSRDKQEVKDSASDPFADLINLKPSRPSNSPQPVKQHWETFD